jgi:hypothetical protein
MGIETEVMFLVEKTGRDVAARHGKADLYQPPRRRDTRPLCAELSADTIRQEKAHEFMLWLRAPPKGTVP